jgi:hypothetical protein
VGRRTRLAPVGDGADRLLGAFRLRTDLIAARASQVASCTNETYRSSKIENREDRFSHVALHFLDLQIEIFAGAAAIEPR